jgi:hypothetical protein
MRCSRATGWQTLRFVCVQRRLESDDTSCYACSCPTSFVTTQLSAGDLLMIQLLRRLGSSGMFDQYRSIAAHVVRGEARPAFKRASDAQLALFSTASAS